MAVVFPVLVNSLLMSTAFQFYHWYKKGKKLPLGLAFFVFVWMSFEYFHMAWEFTWPWLNLGNSFADYPQLIQWYDTLGATGGSLWILTLNALIFYIVKIWLAEKRFLVKTSVVVLGLIVLPMIISLFKYHQFDEKPMGKVRVMMLQPNLDPYHEKYQKDIEFFGKKYTFVSNGTSGLHKIAYELAGGRVPAYPFWVFADENGKMLTHEGLLKEKELNSIFSNHNH